MISRRHESGSTKTWTAAPIFGDANFNLHIVAGLRRRHPSIDILTAQQVHVLDLPDPVLLSFAKDQGRILLTHDRRTIPAHLNKLLNQLPAGEYSPGIMSVEQRLPVGAAIEAIGLIWECSSHDEWRNQFVYLPL